MNERRGQWYGVGGTWKRRIFFAVLTYHLSLTTDHAVYAFGDSDAGTSGAAFLKVAPGARPVSMGEAFTGVSDDIHAVYWNPAGLATLRRPELAAMHMEYFQNIQYEFASFAMPTPSRGTWGVSISNLHVDDLERRSEDTDAATGDFSSSDSAYALHYGHYLTHRLALGITGKLIRQTLDSVHANAFGADMGALYDTGWNDWRVGASMQNFGTKVKFRSESDPLPLTFRLGASKPFLNRKLLMSSDIIMPRDNDIGLAVGAEYKKLITAGVSAAMRTGYRTGVDVGGLHGISAGGGLEFGRAAFDFAWVPFGDLGNAYRFSLHLKFGSAHDDGTPRRLQKASTPDKDRDTSLEQLLSL